jgi:hypothetical protein
LTDVVVGVVEKVEKVELIFVHAAAEQAYSSTQSNLKI